MSSPPPSSTQGLPPPPPPPNPLPTDQTHFTGRVQTSNLYLIAFLAILFLLLIISAAIVIRSYILRRRYQRRLEDAMGPGLLLAPRAQGSKIKRLGTMPKVINTWLAEGGDKWNEMMPISAQPVFVKRKIRVNKQNTQDQTTDVSNATAAPTRITNLFSRFRRSLLHNSDNTLVTNEKQAPIPSTPDYRIRVEMLQLAVLIAMPSPRRSRRKNSILKNLDSDLDDDDEKESDNELPNMVLGVSRVNYRQLEPLSLTLLPLQPKQT